jgi:molecular chaperone DnaK (HSP70)
MKSAVDVDDAEVQKMVEESVEHFFEDVRARQWVEAKLKATETVDATRNGLAECGAELDAAYRQQVEQVLSAVESVLAGEDFETKIGDPKRLKETTAALDETTKPLADLLMDKAMEAMLKKRGLIS